MKRSLLAFALVSAVALVSPPTEAAARGLQVCGTECPESLDFAGGYYNLTDYEVFYVGSSGTCVFYDYLCEYGYVCWDDGPCDFFSPPVELLIPDVRVCTQCA